MYGTKFGRLKTDEEYTTFALHRAIGSSLLSLFSERFQEPRDRYVLARHRHDSEWANFWIRVMGPTEPTSHCQNHTECRRTRVWSKL